MISSLMNVNFCQIALSNEEKEKQDKIQQSGVLTTTCSDEDPYIFVKSIPFEKGVVRCY